MKLEKGICLTGLQKSAMERDDFAHGRIWLTEQSNDLCLDLCLVLMYRHFLAGRLTDEERLRCVDCTSIETMMLPCKGKASINCTGLVAIRMYSDFGDTVLCLLQRLVADSNVKLCI